MLSMTTTTPVRRIPWESEKMENLKRTRLLLLFEFEELPKAVERLLALKLLAKGDDDSAVDPLFRHDAMHLSALASVFFKACRCRSARYRTACSRLIAPDFSELLSLASRTS